MHLYFDHTRLYETLLNNVLFDVATHVEYQTDGNR